MNGASYLPVLGLVAGLALLRRRRAENDNEEEKAA